MLSFVSLFYSAQGGKGRGPEVPWTHSRRWAVLAKLEALQAAWGLPGTDFRQRCRRKRVFNVLEGSNVVYFLILTQVSAVGLITLPSFFQPIVSREVHVEPLVKVGERESMEGEGGARTTEHRSQLKHLH